MTGQFTLSLVAYWYPRTYKKGAILALRSAIGAWFNAPATVTAVPLSYIQAVPPVHEALGLLQPQPHWWRQLSMAPAYAQVSAVAAAPAAHVQFARAVGSACQVLIPRVSLHWALLLLPSKQLRLVSCLSYVALGSIQPEMAQFFVSPNAGHSRRAGIRPMVRGTARNPNDHPHGGRTRAIRYPRTPWGRTAKCSRAVSTLPRLKALSKRHRTVATRTSPYWAVSGGAAALAPIS